MRFRHFLAAIAVVAVPAAGRAADVTPLFPDSAAMAFGLDVKAATTSPLGKKVIGNDKPYDASRKLLKVLFPTDVFQVTDRSLKPLETIANRIERMTVAGGLDRGQADLAVFLEGEIEEDAYIKAAEGYAKAESKPFSTVKLDDRKLLLIGEEASPIYGVQVGKSLFLATNKRAWIDEVLDKHAGKKKATLHVALAAMLKKVKPAETPIWLVIGGMEDLKGIMGVATIGLKEDADFRMEVMCDEEKDANNLTQLFEYGVKYLRESQTSRGKLWNAARIEVKKDGLTVTAVGAIPGKLLAEAYAKQD
jgi:hypothetical protein